MAESKCSKMKVKKKPAHKSRAKTAGKSKPRTKAPPMIEGGY